MFALTQAASGLILCFQKFESAATPDGLNVRECDEPMTEDADTIQSWLMLDIRVQVQMTLSLSVTGL